MHCEVLSSKICADRHFLRIFKIQISEQHLYFVRRVADPSVCIEWSSFWEVRICSSGLEYQDDTAARKSLREQLGRNDAHCLSQDIMEPGKFCRHPL